MGLGRPASQILMNTRIAGLILALSCLAQGCSTTPPIEKRRAERIGVFERLSSEDQTMVKEGRIRVGMDLDAAYIAWGRPDEILESEDAGGRTVTWRFKGVWMEESRYWAYRETARDKGDLYQERYLATDFNPRDYVRAEIVFKEGKVASWRTLPIPLK